MPKVHFYLHKPKAALTYIRLTMNYPGGRLVYYTTHHVKPECWNPTEHRVRKTAGCRNHAEINAGLRQLEVEAERIYWQYHNAGNPLPPSIFRAELDVFWKGRTAPVESKVDFFEFVEQLIAERAASPTFAKNTIVNYRSALNGLRQYQSETKRPVTFSSIDLDFHAAWTAWLTAGGMSANSIYQRIATLKTFLNAAHERGLIEHTKFRSKSFTVKRTDVQKVYLNEAELATLYDLDLSGNDTLSRVRDLFLLGAWSGLRFSDYSALRAENIVVHGGVEIISIRAHKTKRLVSVPVFPVVRAILARNGGAAPAAIGRTQMNVRVKELCKLAGINTPVLLTSFSGGMRVEKAVPKWSLIASHTARRSFATNMYLDANKHGRSYRPIMEVLGQKTERVFFGYICVDGEENARLFAEGLAG